MKIAFAIAAVVVVIGIVILLTAVSDRSQLLRERDAIAAHWTQVNAVLDHRADLVPSLVESMKSYAPKEQALIQEVTEAQSALKRAVTPQQKIRANGRLDIAISRVLVYAERYARLKSSANFLRVQDDLAATENRIAVERRKYNEAVQRYNTDLELFPKNLAAALFGFERNDQYFMTEPGATVAPRVTF